jgi:hypothetical protein
MAFIDYGNNLASCDRCRGGESIVIGPIDALGKILVVSSVQGKARFSVWRKSMWPTSVSGKAIRVPSILRHTSISHRKDIEECCSCRLPLDNSEIAIIVGANGSRGDSHF